MRSIRIPLVDFGGRTVSPGMFADLGVTASFATVDDQLEIAFDVDLTAEQVGAVWERLSSRDDGDQARRAKLRAAAAAGASNLAEMHLAYTLGDLIPDAVLPQT